jgi:hypothetical protein
MLAILATVASVGAQVFSGITANRMAGQQRRLANRTAADVERRGAFEVDRYQRQLAQVQGQQTVGLAAQGIDLTQGTAATIRQQTAEAGAQDVAQLRENIRMEAWGIRRQGQINAQGLRNEAIGQFMQAGATLLTSPLAQDGWARYTNRRTMVGA